MNYFVITDFRDLQIFEEKPNFFSLFFIFSVKKVNLATFTWHERCYRKMPCCLKGTEVKSGFMGFSTSTSVPLFFQVLEVIVQQILKTLLATTLQLRRRNAESMLMKRLESRLP